MDAAADDEYPWGSDGPPEEAYSRVTRDLARIYAPLAPAAEAAVRDLLDRYQVTAHDVLDAERERFSRVIAAAALVPIDGRAATLTLAWTDLPGLTVRLGETTANPVPPCGCDACSESLPDCLAQFEALIDEAESAWAGIRRTRPA